MSKKKKIYITDHSKVRFDERTSYDNTEYKQLAITAFKKGYEFSNFKSPVKEFLESISFDSGKYMAKIYDNHVYIFNNAYGSRLLTVYAVPEEYLPVEQYLIPKEELRPCIVSLIDPDGKRYYWHEFGGLTTDLGEALEFTNQIKAANYVHNNTALNECKDLHNMKIELF